jgi:hypothetical protein
MPIADLALGLPRWHDCSQGDHHHCWGCPRYLIILHCLPAPLCAGKQSCAPDCLTDLHGCCQVLELVASTPDDVLLSVCKLDQLLLEGCGVEVTLSSNCLGLQLLSTPAGERQGGVVGG